MGTGFVGLCWEVLAAWATVLGGEGALSHISKREAQRLHKILYIFKMDFPRWLSGKRICLPMQKNQV